MLQKISNISWLSGFFFLNSFDAGKNIKPEQLYRTLCSKNVCISFNKKDFVKLCLDSNT